MTLLFSSSKTRYTKERYQSNSTKIQLNKIYLDLVSRIKEQPLILDSNLQNFILSFSWFICQSDPVKRDIWDEIKDMLVKARKEYPVHESIIKYSHLKIEQILVTNNII